MMTGADIGIIMNTSVRDTSKLVAKLEVIDNHGYTVAELESPYTIYVTTSGDYQEMISFCADSSVIETIAQNMMHGRELSEEEMIVCAKEFFNILCGQLVSSINKKYHMKTRFSVPDMVKGHHAKSEGRRIENRQIYKYPCGMAKMEISSVRNSN